MSSGRTGRRLLATPGSTSLQTLRTLTGRALSGSPGSGRAEDDAIVEEGGDSPLTVARERRRSSVIDSMYDNIPGHEHAAEDEDVHAHLVARDIAELLEVNNTCFAHIEVKDDGELFTLDEPLKEHIQAELAELLQVTDDVDHVEPPAVTPLPEDLGLTEAELDEQRAEVPYDEYSPSVFSRATPPDPFRLPEDQRVSTPAELLSVHNSPRMTAIVSVWFEDVKIPDPASFGELLSSLSSLQVLGLRRTGLHALTDCNLPNLLTADLQSNLFRNLDSVVSIVQRSPYLQNLNVLYCPVCKTSTWTKPHPEPGAPEWELVARLPELQTLNREALSFTQYSSAVERFGTPSAIQLLGVRNFDIAFCLVMSQVIEGMQGVWQPLSIEHLGLTGQKLSTVRVGVLGHLHTLNVSGNHIESLQGCGLEQCEWLETLDVSNNKIASHEEVPLEMLTSLLHFMYNRNPMASQEGCREHVLYRCRNSRGTNTLPGLVSLNEREVTFENRIESFAFCDRTIDVPQLRWRLGLTMFYGRALLQSSADMIGNVKVLMLPGLGLTYAPVRELHSVSVLDLRDNQLEMPEGVESLLYLRVLDLSGNPNLKVKQIVTRLQRRPVTTLEALALAPTKAKNTAQFRQLLLSSFLSTNPRLRVVERAPVQIEDRIAEARKAKRLNAGKLEAYKFGLAVAASAVPPTERLYGVQDATLARQYDFADVEHLLTLSNLGFTSHGIDLSPFCNLLRVNLSHNQLDTLRGMGLEHLPALEALDVSHNRIAMTIPDVAALLDQMLSLEAVALAENPAFRRYAIARRQLIGAMRRMREVECPLHIIDRTVTIDERVSAWQLVGGAEDAEALRTDVALFSKSPVGVPRPEVEKLELDRLSLSAPRLIEYAALEVLRLRGNNISSLVSMGLLELERLRVLDLRDNQLLLAKDAEVENTMRNISVAQLEFLGLSGNRGAVAGDSKYRQRVVRALPHLAAVGCPLRYLDDGEISAAEIVDSMPMSPEREQLRFDIARARSVGAQDPSIMKFLDLSHQGLTRLSLEPFTNLQMLTLAFNALTLQTLAECGLRTLFFLTHLDLSSNMIDSMDGLADLIDGFVRLEVLEVEGNRCFASNTPALRRAFLKRLSGIESADYPLKTLNGHEITLAERMRALASQKTGRSKNRHKAGLGAATVHLALVLQQRGVTGMEVELDLSGLELQRLGMIGKAPMFPNLLRLNLSHNRLTTLEKNTLNLLPRLYSLDLRSNKISSVANIIAGTQHCHTLRVLNIRGATKNSSSTSNPESYAPKMFARMPALLNVDEVHAPARLSQSAMMASEFLFDLAGVSANQLKSIDMSDLDLPSKGFFYVLAALCAVPVAHLKLHGNFRGGVGPQRSAYRKYVIPAMGEQLRSLDDSPVEDDERVNLLSWLEQEEERYGKLVIRDEWAKSKGQAQLALQKSLGKQAEKNANKWAIQDDDDDDADMDDGEFEGDDTQFADDDEGDENGDEDGEGEGEDLEVPEEVSNALSEVGEGAEALQVLTIKTTGTVLAKIEVMISFFQVYGLVLAWDRDITFPSLWTDVKIYYDYFPQLFALNIDVVFTEFNVTLSEEARQLVQFSAVMGFVLLLSMLYRMATSLDNTRWIKDFYTDWELTQKRVRVLYLLSLLASLFLGMSVDYDASMARLRNRGFVTAQAYTMAGLCMAGCTLFYNLYFVVANAFRRHYIRDDMTDPPRVGGSEFVKWWSLKKRTLQKTCLFLLTLFYMPVARITFENFAPETDRDVLEEEGCTHYQDGELCCLAAYPTLRCVDFFNPSMLHIFSAVFVLCYVLGMPAFFCVLVNNGVGEIDRQGYAIQHKEVSDQIHVIHKEREKLRRSIKNSRKKAPDMLSQYYAMGETIAAKQKYLANLYASEVRAHPKAQSYLFQAYERKWRFYKIIQMMEKLSLVLITLFVNNAEDELVRYVLGNVTIAVAALFTLSAHPFSDSSEDLMDCLSRVTNTVNVSVSLSIYLDTVDPGFANLLLIGFNGVNLTSIFGSIVASPVRAWRARAAFLKEEEKRILEFRKDAEDAGTEMLDMVSEQTKDLLRDLEGISPNASGVLPPLDTPSSSASDSPVPSTIPHAANPALQDPAGSLAAIRKAARAAKGLPDLDIGVESKDAEELLGRAGQRLNALAADARSEASDLAGDVKEEAGPGARAVGRRLNDLAGDVKEEAGPAARRLRSGAGAAGRHLNDLAADVKEEAGPASRRLRAEAGSAGRRLNAMAATAKDEARDLGGRGRRELGRLDVDKVAKQVNLRESIADMDIGQADLEELEDQFEGGVRDASEDSKEWMESARERARNVRRADLEDFADDVGDRARDLAEDAKGHAEEYVDLSREELKKRIDIRGSIAELEMGGRQFEDLEDAAEDAAEEVEEGFRQFRRR